MVVGSDIFDIWNIFVNEVIGSTWISIFLLLIVTNIFSIKSKFPFPVIALFNLLIMAAVVAQTSIMVIWAFIVLFVGVLFYIAVSKALST